MAPKKSDISKAGTERLERIRIEQRYSTARLAIQCLAIVVAIFFAKEAIVAFAGQSTTVIVQGALRILGNLKFTAALGLTGSAAVWAVCERALRRRKVESMQARIRLLETMIDPKRSTSGLLPNGKTNPADN